MDFGTESSREPSIVEVVSVETMETRGNNNNINNNNNKVDIESGTMVDASEVQLQAHSLPPYMSHGNHQLLVHVGGGGGANPSIILDRTDAPPPEESVTLPSHIAIPVGLAQIFVGVSMVICGALALRYQSNLFYYGSGLWAGTVAGIAGILGVTASKVGLPKPKWLCGGRRWQIHIFLGVVMLALSTAIVAAIFSTSGLVRDTQHDYSKDVNDMTPDEEMFEKRKSSGIMINAVLLLLSLLQILLSFCSLGVALRVLCTRHCGQNGALLSPGSADGSEVTVREILGQGTGPEYEARKDRLLRWLGHQRRNLTQPKAIMAKNMAANSIYSCGKGVVDNEARMYPRFVALSHSHSPSRFIQQPPPPLPFVIPAPLSAPVQRSILIPSGPPSLPAPYPFPQQLLVPVIPFPMRHHHRSVTPVSATNSCDRRQMRGRRRRGGNSSAGGSIGGRSKFSTSSFPHRRTEESDKEIEITEEEVSKTYTGLDRVVAEEFISNTMNSSG